MKKVLLTGVAGFIASETARQLLEQGVQVVGVDNMNDYYDVRMKEHRLDQLKDKDGFSFQKMDIEDLDGVMKIFDENKDFDAVLNLAARAGVHYSMINPHVYMTTNANATLNLLEAMRKYEIKKLVLASTSSLYAGQEMPFNETLPVNTPISPYAASKKAAEMMAYTYHSIHQMDISVVRYFTVYGPLGRPDMSIFRFIKWVDAGQPIELFGDGTQSRDFTYVTDIARGTILATKDVGYEVINLGGGKKPVSLNYIIGLIEEGLGKKAVIDYKDWHKTDMKSTWADIDKAEKLLGWKPETGIEEGLEKCIKFYKENDWLKDIKL